MKRSEFCKQEKTGEAAVHLNPTDVVSIRPWWSSSSHWERHTQGSRSKLHKNSSLKGLRFCIKLQITPVRTSGREEGGDECEEEQEQRAASRQMGQPAPGARN